MTQTVVVLGSTGFLGPAIVAALRDPTLVSDVQVVHGGRALVDLGNDDQSIHAALDSLSGTSSVPVALVNASSVGPGRGDEAAMRRVNVFGSAAVAAWCARRSVRLVHVSSDVVFTGTDGPYNDDATPDQTVGYGGSKAAGEHAVAAADPAAALVRPSLIWDPVRIDNGTQSFLDRLDGGDGLTLWPDVLRQPVPAQDLAQLLVHLALDATNEAGPINAVGAEVMDRATFGKRMLTWFGRDVDGLGDRITLASAPDGVALDLRMSTDRVDRLGLRLRGVSEVLTA